MINSRQKPPDFSFSFISQELLYFVVFFLWVFQFIYFFFFILCLQSLLRSFLPLVSNLIFTFGFSRYARYIFDVNILLLIFHSFCVFVCLCVWYFSFVVFFLSFFLSFSLLFCLFSFLYHPTLFFNYLLFRSSFLPSILSFFLSLFLNTLWPFPFLSSVIFFSSFT